MKTEISREMIDYAFTKYPRLFEDTDKARKICELRLMGLTYKAIGDVFHICDSSCREYVVKINAVWRNHLRRLEREKERLFTNHKRIAGRVYSMSKQDMAQMIARMCEGMEACDNCPLFGNCPETIDASYVEAWLESEVQTNCVEQQAEGGEV